MADDDDDFYGFRPRVDMSVVDAIVSENHDYELQLRKVKSDLFSLHWHQRRDASRVVREVLVRDGQALLRDPLYRRALCDVLHATDRDEPLYNPTLSADSDAPIDTRPRFRLADIVTYRNGDAIITLPLAEYQSLVEPSIGRYSDYLEGVTYSINMNERCVYTPPPPATAPLDDPLSGSFMRKQAERAVFSQPKEAWQRGSEHDQVFYTLTLPGKARVQGLDATLIAFLGEHYAGVAEIQPGAMRCDIMGSDLVLRVPAPMFEHRITADILAYKAAQPSPGNSRA